MLQRKIKQGNGVGVREVWFKGVTREGLPGKEPVKQRPEGVSHIEI